MSKLVWKKRVSWLLIASMLIGGAGMSSLADSTDSDSVDLVNDVSAYGEIENAITINEPESTELEKGETLNLEAEVAHTVSNATVTWSSSDEDIATVEGNDDYTATVTGVAAGTVTITAKMTGTATISDAQEDVDGEATVELTVTETTTEAEETTTEAEETTTEAEETTTEAEETTAEAETTAEEEETTTEEEETTAAESLVEVDPEVEDLVDASGTGTDSTINGQSLVLKVAAIVNDVVNSTVETWKSNIADIKSFFSGKKLDSKAIDTSAFESEDIDLSSMIVAVDISLTWTDGNTVTTDELGNKTIKVAYKLPEENPLVDFINNDPGQTGKERGIAVLHYNEDNGEFDAPMKAELTYEGGRFTGKMGFSMSHFSPVVFVPVVYNTTTSTTTSRGNSSNSSGGGGGGSSSPGVSSGGWSSDENGWRYLRSGSYVASEWVTIGGFWYYIGADTYMVQGWYYDAGYGQWFYLAPNGTGCMLTGWQPVGDKWYYMNPDAQAGTLGAMLANTWVGDWYVGEDGAWMPEVTK